MYNKSKLGVFLLIFCFSGCTIDQFCEKKELCDLGAKFLPIIGAGLGVDISIISEVYNAIKSEIECTETAGTSTSEYVLEKLDGSGIFRPYDGMPDPGYKSLGSIEPNKKIVKEYSVRFNDPGMYRWVLRADYNDRVNERDELNNSGKDEGNVGRLLPSNNITYSDTIVILDDPNFVRGDQPLVIVKFK